MKILKSGLIFLFISTSAMSQLVLDSAQIKKNIWQRKFKVGAETGIIAGSAYNTDKNALSFAIVNYFHIMPKTSIGAGAGLDFFINTYCPLFVDIRHYFDLQTYAPFVFFRSGITFPVEEPRDLYLNRYYSNKKIYQLGYILDPGIGFLIPFNKRNAFTFSASYRRQWVEFHVFPQNDNMYEQLEKVNRINLRIGFLFY